MLDPPQKADAPPLTNLIALLNDWGIDVGNNIVVDVSGMGQLIGTDASVPVAAPPYPPHPITSTFQLLTAYPLARDRSRRSRAASTATPRRRSSRPAAQLGGDRPQVADDRAARSRSTTTRATRGRSRSASRCRRRSAARRRRPTPATPDDAPKPETRVVVIGDSDFAANGDARHPGQPRPVHEHVGWLAQQENLISIRPRDPTTAASR